jgi:hypothetical protein
LTFGGSTKGHADLAEARNELTGNLEKPANCLIAVAGFLDIVR